MASTRHRVTVVRIVGVRSFAFKMRCSAVPSVELSGNTDEKISEDVTISSISIISSSMLPAVTTSKIERNLATLRSQLRLEENVLTVLRAATDTV